MKQNKKVLIFGLGNLGGGVFSTLYFAKNGCQLRITDLKTKKELKDSLQKLKNISAKFILGKHRKEDFLWADLIVVNPGVSYRNQFLKLAREEGKTIVNDAILFLQKFPGEIIAITGTRGKTTTTNWLFHFLKNAKGFRKVFIGGNSSKNPLSKILLQKPKEKDLAIVELSSFQLELVTSKIRKPRIAIITNLLPDHLNRYRNLKEYALKKAKIFQGQRKEDLIIFKKDNPWTKFFLSLKPKSKVYFIAQKPLADKEKGIYRKGDFLYLKLNGRKKYLSVKKFLQNCGEHNVDNLMFAVLTAILMGISATEIKKKIKNLPTIRYRQEIILKEKQLTIINDAASTSPEAVIAALKRFAHPNLILITGGTDKNLSYQELAKVIKKKIKPANLILLEGSATLKLISELQKLNYPIKNLFPTLKECLQKAFLIKTKPKLILFSPGSASFEKFKNEFDRGKQLNSLMKFLLNKND